MTKKLTTPLDAAPDRAGTEAPEAPDAAAPDATAPDAAAPDATAPDATAPDAPTAQAQTNLGARLRARRRARKLTLQAVADEAGLSVGFISQVERDITQPSLASLASIARVLDMPLSQCLVQPGGEQRFTVAGERPRYSISEGASQFERLSSEFAGNTLHSLIIHEPPGHRIAPIQHAGEEMILVLEGEITVEIDGDQRVLRRGDSVHHPSNQIHSSWNHTDATTTVLWVGTFDVFDGARQ